MRRSTSIAVTFAAAAGGCGRIDFDPTPVRDGGASDAAVVDATPVDGAISGACVGTLLFADDFGDNVPEPLFVANGPADVTPYESGGELILSLAMTAAQHYGAYQTAMTYPSAGLCAVAEVTSAPEAPAGVFFKAVAGVLEIEFYALGGGTIELRTQDSEVIIDSTLLPFDLQAMRFWRLRQTGTVTRWETSRDGVQYVERKSLDGFFPPAPCILQFGGGTNIAVTNAGEARFTAATATGP